MILKHSLNQILTSGISLARMKVTIASPTVGQTVNGMVEFSGTVDEFNMTSWNTKSITVRGNLLQICQN